MILVIPIFIPHLGCPHDCLFCNQQKISGENRQDITPESVNSTIDEWLPRARNKSKVQVAFFGGSFTCLPLAQQIGYLETVQPYIRSGEVDEIRLSTRPDCISSEIIEILKKYHVKVIELGVQSFDDTVLIKSIRGHNAAQCEEALQLLKSEGFTVGLQFMAGLPGETTRSFIKGIHRVAKLKPEFIRLYPVLVIKDSGLEKLYHEKMYSPLSLRKAIALAARTYEILSAAEVAIVRFGLQPSEELKDSVIAGPYHPAFGELVQSRTWLKRIRAQCNLLGEDETLSVYVSHREISAVVGHKKRNIKRLQDLGFVGRFEIVAEKKLPRGTVQYVVS